MTLPGETIGTTRTTCVCGKRLELQVLQSAAGYYIGFWCDECGPYSRESGYYNTREAAQTDLDSGEFGRY